MASNFRSLRSSGGALTWVLFAVVGTIFFVILFIRPMKTYLDAKNWVETPCVIERSEVARKETTRKKTNSNRTETSVSYKVEVLYNYEFKGKSYTGDRYDLMSTSSSGREAKAEVVKKLKPGTETVCYVDPDEPGNSIINRDAGPGMMWGLLSLPFMLIGYGGLFKVIRDRTANRQEPRPPDLVNQ